MGDAKVDNIILGKECRKVGERKRREKRGK